MPFQVHTEQGLKEMPRIGSWWQHSNGNIYMVFAITNTSDRQEEYPAMICYRGPNGKEWSKLLTQWYKKMTPLDEVFIKHMQLFKGKVLDDQLIEYLAESFKGMAQTQQETA